MDSFLADFGLLTDEPNDVIKDILMTDMAEYRIDPPQIGIARQFDDGDIFEKFKLSVPDFTAHRNATTI